MDDALLVRGFERLGNLPCERQRLDERQRPARDPPIERLAVDELHDEEVPHAGLFEAVELRDMRMIERRESLRLALEARDPIGIGRERVRKNLHGDIATEL